MYLSEFVRTDADKSIKEWEQFAHALTSGEGLPRWVLRDHALAIINALAGGIVCRGRVWANSSLARSPAS